MYADLLQALRRACEDNAAVARRGCASLSRTQSEQLLRAIACRNIALAEYVMASLLMMQTSSTRENK